MRTDDVRCPYCVLGDEFMLMQWILHRFFWLKCGDIVDLQDVSAFTRQFVMAAVGRLLLDNADENMTAAATRWEKNFVSTRTRTHNEPTIP
jgi:hypothetical protein